MNIITLINDCIIRSKYKDKHTKIILIFTRQPFLVLCTLTHKHRKKCHNYGPFQFYGTVRYYWARSIDNMPPLGLYMKPILNKNKHKLLHMIKAYTSHIHYLHITDSVLPWMNTRWTCCFFITRILYFILVTRNKKMLLYDYFFDSLFAPHTCFSQIYSHDTSLTFVYTSKLFVSIITLTKMRDC